MASILDAAKLIQKGEVVAFPTETVYGLGGDATNDAAIEKIYYLKGRPSENPLIVHLASVEDVYKWVKITPNSPIDKQFNKLTPFWPGPLTIIFPESKGLSPKVTAGASSVGIRIPNHDVALEFISKCNLPIAAPSANISNYVSPTNAQHVQYCFGDELTILDGGASIVGIESTIIELSLDGEVTLLRPGAISPAMLREALGEEITLKENIIDDVPSAPGQYEKHYSPVTPVKYLDEVTQISTPEKTALLSFSPRSKLPKHLLLGVKEHIALTNSGNLEEGASNLYSALRALDLLDLELILVEKPPTDGIGLALNDRLKKACCE